MRTKITTEQIEQIAQEHLPQDEPAYRPTAEEIEGVRQMAQTLLDRYHESEESREQLFDQFFKHTIRHQLVGHYSRHRTESIKAEMAERDARHAARQAELDEQAALAQARHRYEVANI